MDSRILTLSVLGTLAALGARRGSGAKLPQPRLTAPGLMDFERTEHVTYDGRKFTEWLFDGAIKVRVRDALDPRAKIKTRNASGRYDEDRGPFWVAQFYAPDASGEHNAWKSISKDRRPKLYNTIVDPSVLYKSPEAAIAAAVSYASNVVREKRGSGSLARLIPPKREPGSNRRQIGPYVIRDSDEDWAEFYYRSDVPSEVLNGQFDYLTDDDDSSGFMKDGDDWYHTGDFERIKDPLLEADGFVGVHPQSYSSGILLRLSRDGSEYKLQRFYTVST